MTHPTPQGETISAHNRGEDLPIRLREPLEVEKATSRLEDAFDHEVCIEKVVDFASMWNRLQDCTRVPEQLSDMIEDCADDSHLHPTMKPLMDLLAEEDEEMEMSMLEKLQEIPAASVNVIYMQGATPVRHYHGPDGWSSGWGHYYTRWVAAPTFTQAWALLVKWAQEVHEKDKAEALSKQEDRP